MKYVFCFIIAGLFISGCKSGHLEGMCAHPAIMGGMPIQLPEGAQINGDGTLILKNPQTGEYVYFTGAACAYEVK